MRKVIFSIAIILIIVVITVAVGDTKDSVSENKIKVGVIAGLTGEFASLYSSARDGLLMSLEDAPNIEVIVEDTGLDTKKGVSAYNKLVHVDKVDVIVGMDSLVLHAIRPLINKDEIPYIHVFESVEHIEGDYVAQVMPYSSHAFEVLGEEASQRYDSIAIITSAGVELYQDNVVNMKKGIEADEIVLDIMINSGVDYKTDALKVLQSGADAYTIHAPLDDSIKFIKAIEAQRGDNDIDLVCEGNMEFTIDQYIEALGKEIFDGCILTLLADRQSSEFKAKFEEKYGYKPIFGADYAYDAGTIIKELQDIPTDRWIEEIVDMRFYGESGDVVFDEKASRLPDTVLKEFNGISFEVIE